jgi:hypothetical protein
VTRARAPNPRVHAGGVRVLAWRGAAMIPTQNSFVVVDGDWSVRVECFGLSDKEWWSVDCACASLSFSKGWRASLLYVVRNEASNTQNPS